jgi:hypothetical protein
MKRDAKIGMRAQAREAVTCVLRAWCTALHHECEAKLDSTDERALSS